MWDSSPGAIHAASAPQGMGNQGKQNIPPKGQRGCVLLIVLPSFFHPCSFPFSLVVAETLGSPGGASTDSWLGDGNNFSLISEPPSVPLLGKSLPLFYQLLHVLKSHNLVTLKHQTFVVRVQNPESCSVAVSALGSSLHPWRSSSSALQHLNTDIYHGSI